MRSGYVRVLTLLGIAGAAFPLAFVGKDSSKAVARGITTRRVSHGISSIRVIEADLTVPGVRVEIAAEDLSLRKGRVVGKSLKVADWLKERGAAAGVNGGFFGGMVDADHKEIVGLLKLAGKVRSAAPTYHSTATGKDYARSAFGIAKDGRPRMAWVTSRAGETQTVLTHDAPEFTSGGVPWKVQQAVACGPRLIHGGKTATAEKAERLVSPGALPRTFLGYGGPTDKPTRLVLCAADGMEFSECAAFLHDFFQKQYHFDCREAMCLDGGASTQAAWREGAGYTADPDPSTSVPTAVLVYGPK